MSVPRSLLHGVAMWELHDLGGSGVRLGMPALEQDCRCRVEVVGLALFFLGAIPPAD